MSKHISVSDDADIRAVLMSKDFSAVRLHELYTRLSGQFGLKLDAFTRFMDHSLFYSEGQTHKRLKRVASLTTRTNLLNPRVDYRALAQDTADGLLLGTPINLARDYSTAFVDRVVIEAYGLNPEEAENYGRWIRNLEWLFSPIPPWREVKDLNASAIALQQSLTDWFTREEGKHLKASSLYGLTDDLSLEEITYVVSAVLLGAAATFYTLTNGLFIVLSDDQLYCDWKAEFQADPAVAAKKFVTVASSVPDVSRLCVRAAEIGGQVFQPNDRIRVHLMPQEGGVSACPHAASSAHQRFGVGRHKCVGEMLAYEIIAAGMSVFFETFSSARLISDEVVHDQVHPLKRIKALPVILHRSRSQSFT